MATIAPMSSEQSAEETPRLIAKPPRKSELEFLKTPPQAAFPGLPKEAPSELHFTQLGIGGDQRISLMI